MPGIIQRSLAGGEISGALLARGDTTKYATGWYEGSNWFVDRNGTALNRAGTQYVAPTKTANDDVRNLAWVFNDEQSYELELGEGYIRFVQDGGYLLTGAQSDWADATAYVPGDIVVDGAAGDNSGDYFYCVATHTSSDGDNGPHDGTGLLWFWYPLTSSGSSAILEVPTPYLQAELAEIDDEQSADVMTLCHRNHAPHELTRLGATQWTMLPIRFGPIQDAPTTLDLGSATGTGSGNNLRYAVTAVRAGTFEESIGGPRKLPPSDKAITITAGADISVNNTGHSLADDDLVFIIAVNQAAATTAHENAVRALQGKAFTVAVTDADNFTLRDTADMFEAPVLQGSHPSMTVDYQLGYWEMVADTPALTGAGDDIELTWDAAAEAERYYIYRSVDRSPFGFMAETTDTSWTDTGEVTPDESFTLPQYRDPFVAGEWPAVSTYHQQRHLFAGSIESPQTVRASVVGDFRNFSTRSTTTDDDAIEFTIAGGEANEIVGLDVLGQLIIRTTGSVWTARGNSDGALTPTAINLERLANEGSARIRGLIVGDSLLYPQARGSIIRELRYDLNTGGYGGYAGSDITIFASHMFQGRTVKSWAYAASPFAIVWVTLDDGSCVALTHVQEQDIRAWHKHSFGGTSSAVTSVCAIPEGGIDTPYFIVKRTIDGNVVRYHERLRPRLAGASDYNVLCDSHFLDSSLSYDGRNTGATTIEVGQDMPLTDPPTGLGLTSSPGIFAASDVGNEFAVTLADGVAYRFLVTFYNGTTSVNVTSVGAVPAQSLLNAATTTWTKYVDEFSGLDHLEGETVGIFGDGTHVGTATVTSGAISTADVYACVDIGLPIDNKVDSLDLDLVNQIDAVGSKLKLCSRLTAYCYATKGLTGGNPGSPLATLREDDRDAERDTTSTALFSGKLRANFDSRPNRHGRIRFVQPLPLPACIAGFIPLYKITEDT